MPKRNQIPESETEISQEVAWKFLTHRHVHVVLIQVIFQFSLTSSGQRIEACEL